MLHTSGTIFDMVGVSRNAWQLRPLSADKPPEGPLQLGLDHHRSLQNSLGLGTLLHVELAAQSGLGQSCNTAGLQANKNHRTFANTFGVFSWALPGKTRLWIKNIESNKEDAIFVDEG